MRLSVIIPAIGSQQAIEETLVSVLSNRPDDCEILLACDQDFVDPYDMEDEVEFVRGAIGDNFAVAANLALDRAQGVYVAIVAAGTEVSTDWAEGAMRRMDTDSRLGSVAPLVLRSSADSTSVDSLPVAGLQLTAAGCRQLRRGQREEGQREEGHLQEGQRQGAQEYQATTENSKYGTLPIDGPTSIAGVYRRSALMQVDGWDGSMSPQLTALELASNLKSSGWSSLCAMESYVRAADTPRIELSGFRYARDLQRIYLRSRSRSARIPALFVQSVLILWQRATRILKPAAAGELLGRLAGVCPAARLGLSSVATPVVSGAKRTADRKGSRAQRRAA